MRGIGVVQDGFPFTHAELDRGAPRFWWSTGRKRAYAAALAARGSGEAAGGGSPGAFAGPPGIGATAAVAGAASKEGGGGSAGP